MITFADSGYIYYGLHRARWNWCRLYSAYIEMRLVEFYSRENAVSIHWMNMSSRLLSRRVSRDRHLFFFFLLFDSSRNWSGVSGHDRKKKLSSHVCWVRRNVIYIYMYPTWLADSINRHTSAQILLLLDNKKKWGKRKLGSIYWMSIHSADARLLLFSCFYLTFFPKRASTPIKWYT